MREVQYNTKINHKIDFKYSEQVKPLKNSCFTAQCFNLLIVHKTLFSNQMKLYKHNIDKKEGQFFLFTSSSLSSSSEDEELSDDSCCFCCGDTLLFLLILFNPCWINNKHKDSSKNHLTGILAFLSIAGCSFIWCHFWALLGIIIEILVSF